MKKCIHFLIVLIASSYSLFGQHKVRGIVVDIQGKPLEYVNIVAMQQPDSSFISGCATDAMGSFRFDNLPSECYLRFSSIGYQAQNIKANEQMRVVLQEEPQKLAEVSVIARSIKERPRGYTISMHNNPLTQGKKVMQVLELLPHIHLEEGKVNILDRSVEAIYVDGLRILDQRELENLPVEHIARIEVDYTSSVREGASATGGVLRIYLKEQAKAEWSMNLGSETLYMPVYGWRGANLDNYLSVRWNKLTLRNAMEAGKQLYLGDEETSITDKTRGLIQHSLDEFRNWTTSFSNRLSVSYQIAPKHLVASSLLYRYQLETPTHTLTDLLHDNNSFLYQRNPIHLWQWLNTYKWSVSPKTTFSLFTDVLSRHLELATIDQKPYIYNGSSVQQTHMYRIKTMLERRLKNGAKFTFGSDLQWLNQPEKTVGFVKTDMSSSMSSLFSTFASRVGSLQYELGLRVQSNTIQVVQAERTYDYNYIGLYPSLSAMYLIDKKYNHLLSVNVSRVMGSIPYSAISGYRQYNGSYDYSIGNPNLSTPIGTQAMALLSIWGKLNLSLGVLHYKSPIYFERKIDSNQEETTYTIPMNGRYQTLGIASLEWQHKITKWWNTKTSATLRSHSADAGVLVRNQMGSVFRHKSIFTFTPSFSAGLGLMYEPTCRYLDRTMEAVGAISVDVYKTLLKGKMDIRFNSTIYRKERSAITSKEQFVHHYHNLTRSPSFSLSISYRLGSGTKIKALEETKALQLYQKIEDAK